MKSISNWLVRGVSLAAMFLAIDAQSTLISFDIYTNSVKTLRPPNGALGFVVPQSYADNVNNFEPVGQFEGQYYYSYGTNGGLTPNVTVEYRRSDFPTPMNNGRVWNTGYGDLAYALYPNPGPVEIRFTPDAGYSVTLESFDLAAFGANQAGQTVKIVRDYGLPGAITLWAAGPDGSVTVTGGASHNAYSPMVYSDLGHYISVLYGPSGNIAGDNFVFSQQVPEPGTITLLLAGGLVLWRTAHARALTVIRYL